MDNPTTDLTLDARELCARVQQINPDLFARVVAEARADKLQALIDERNAQTTEPEQEPGE